VTAAYKRPLLLQLHLAAGEAIAAVAITASELLSLACSETTSHKESHEVDSKLVQRAKSYGWWNKR
jgi:hypothetical protein